MADELDTLVDSIKSLLEEITEYKQVHAHEPDVISTSCEAAVLADVGTHGQYGVMVHEEVHTLRIRSYVKVGADIEYPESLTRQLINLLQDKMNAHVTLDGAATTSRLTGYRTGYLNIAGVLCRIVDTLLEATILVNTAYA